MAVFDPSRLEQIQMGQGIVASLVNKIWSVPLVERKRLTGLQAREDALLKDDQTGSPAARALLWDVCAAKRALFLHDESLRPVTKLLFSKRHPFHPSHNYSVQLDSRWRPGGGVWSLEIPMEDGSLVPEKAQPASLFDAGAGVVRDPSLSFDATKIYYGYRSDAKEYYRIFEQDVSSGARRFTPRLPWKDALSARTVRSTRWSSLVAARRGSSRLGKPKTPSWPKAPSPRACCMTSAN